MSAPTVYPLAWPDGLPRTSRRMVSPFRVGLERAVSDLQDALRLFGADSGVPVRNVIISSNVALGCKRPADPGVAVYFDWDGATRCIAVDRFPTPEANVRAIYQILEGRRQELRYGGLHIVRAAFQGFAALPAPAHWREVLGLNGGPVTRDIINAAYRRLARERHPDAGGSEAAMAELNAARAAAQKEITT